MQQETSSADERLFVSMQGNNSLAVSHM